MEQLCSTLEHTKTTWVLYNVLIFSEHIGACEGMNMCVQVHVQMYVCLQKLQRMHECLCGLLQKTSKLGFIIKVRGSPLAPFISQTCPTAHKQ